jgi:hypothetical protein
LTSLPDLSLCTTLDCSGCTALTSLPDLPVCNHLYCAHCANITYISVPFGCEVDCEYSPIANYNNDLYLSYIKDHCMIITGSMKASHNYEKGVIDIIAGYL